MIKKIFSALCVVFFATSVMAQTGLTCDDPIPVDKNYKGHVEVDPEVGYTELWYTASTYDLPLHVYFSPNTLESVWSPEVVVDLTCTPGVYDDPKVDSLMNMVEDFGLQFPVELLCDKVVRNGKVEWDLSINQSYRDQLAEFGVTYNVPAYVKVVYYEGGSISMTPDTAFTSCMDISHYILMDDTIEIMADDYDRSFVVPYAEWQDDSIRFVWTGEQPAQIYLATTTCDFAVDGGYVWNSYEVTSETPYKLYSAQMKEDIKNQQGGGVFYGKIVSTTPGKLVVEKIPMNKPKGDAVSMQYDQVIQVGANDPTLYCFPRTWAATQFIASAPAATSVYFSNHPDFTTSTDDANVLAAYEFDKEDGQRALYLSNTEVKSLTDNVIDDYVYVRFQAAAATTITPSAWIASRCVVNSVLIHPNKTFTIANNSNTIYRFKYDDFAGYGFVLKWANTLTSLPTYVADTCTFGLTTGDPHVIRYTNIREGKQMTIKPEVYEEWASRVDADGYLYVRFDSERAGDVTFVCEKPVELDPVYTYESAAICFGEGYEWNGQTYTESGEYTFTSVAANGADSIVTLTLTVYPQTEATTEEVTVGYGETYEWHGVTYAESGEYTIILQDENGCDYQATLLLTVEEEPVSPCVAASTLLEPVAELTLNLGNAFDIYRIDYQAWLASGVNLVWTGRGALHTFVAKDCEFAVAIYHKDVVNYTEVPAEGNVVLSKAILTPLAQYVDADGYLYVRFLTELEGQLTTALAE